MKKTTLLFIAVLAFGTLFSQKSTQTTVPNLNANAIEDVSETTIEKQNIDSNRFLGDCNIGNEIDQGWDPGNFSQNFILGIKFTLIEIGTLNAINFLGNNTGNNVMMAVYDDLAGVPNDLIAETAVATVGAGVVSLPVTPMTLPVGDYWVMAIYDVDGGHSNVDTESTGTVVYYQAVNFGAPLPANASGFITYTGQNFQYFLDIDCGELGINDNLQNLVSVFPNPVVSKINIKLPSNTELLSSSLVDISGKLVIYDLQNGIINVSHLAKGIYFLNLKTSIGDITKKIIKY